MLTSRRSPRASRARSLHARKARREEHAFLVEGPTLVAEALDAGIEIEELFHIADLDGGSREVVARARETGVDILTVSPDVLESVAETRTPQGIVAVARSLPERAVSDIIRSSAAMVVALDRVADPGNLGTIVRTAEGAGASGLVLLGACADPWSPKAVRASAGSAFRVPIALADAEGVLQATRMAGLTLLAADVSAGIAPWEAVSDRTAGLVWLFGSESHGLDEGMIAMTDVRIRIPMAGAIESLNLAASVAVCLFTQVRTRMTD